MLALLLLPVLSDQGSKTTIALENGSIAIQSGVSRWRYWGTSDTYLDGDAPMENNGDSHVLEGGPQRTILLKFGDLEQLGRQKVIKATLFLTPSIGGKPHLSSIRTVSLPWGEGPLRRPFFTNKALVAANWSATWKERHAGADGMAWQQNGATSPGDSQVVEGAMIVDDGKVIAISGLERAVQNMLDRWYENNGFALMFSTPSEFFSSKNVTGKPRLVLELEPLAAPKGPDLAVTLIEAKYGDSDANPPTVWPRDGSGVTYIAHIKNVGDADADAFSGAWNARERLGSSFDITRKLGPGEETTVEVKRTYNADNKDHRTQALGFLIKPKGSDSNANNDYVEIQENAIPLMAPSADMQYAIRSFNEYVLGRSRFSFAPEGALERFRIAGFEDKSGMANTAAIFEKAGLIQFEKMQPKVMKIEGKDVYLDSRDRWPGLFGGGCSANEISVPGEIQLPYMANYNSVFDQYELYPSGLMSASDVAALNANLGKPTSGPRTMAKLPGTVIIRALNRDGDILPNTELRFYQTKDGEIQTTDAAFRLVTGDGGSILLPARVGSDGKSDHFGGLRSDGSNGVYLISATRNGVTDFAWLKAWQLCDSVSRTNKPAVFVELRFNVPYAEIDSSRNVAEGAVFTDSAKTDAVKLATLAKGANITLPNEKGAWLEIDLGKDRTVTEIDLIGKRGSFWQRFSIVTYFSGQPATAASPFAHEVDWDFNLATRPDVDGIGNHFMAYRGSGRSVRHIRLVCKEPSGQKAELAMIRVYGAKG
jgi:hypothetical protein